jgi:hypothetical protein
MPRLFTFAVESLSPEHLIGGLLRVTSMKDEIYNLPHGLQGGLNFLSVESEMRAVGGDQDLVKEISLTFSSPKITVYPVSLQANNSSNSYNTYQNLGTFHVSPSAPNVDLSLGYYEASFLPHFTNLLSCFILISITIYTLRQWNDDTFVFQKLKLYFQKGLMLLRKMKSISIESTSTSNAGGKLYNTCTYSVFFPSSICGVSKCCVFCLYSSITYISYIYTHIIILTYIYNIIAFIHNYHIVHIESEVYPILTLYIF